MRGGGIWAQHRCGAHPCSLQPPTSVSLRTVNAHVRQLSVGQSPRFRFSPKLRRQNKRTNKQKAEVIICCSQIKPKQHERQEQRFHVYFSSHFISLNTIIDFTKIVFLYQHTTWLVCSLYSLYLKQDTNPEFKTQKHKNSSIKFNKNKSNIIIKIKEYFFYLIKILNPILGIRQ